MSALPAPNPDANDRDACRRKRRYWNASAALVAAAKRGVEGSLGLSVYECPECGGWHLTKMEQVV